MLQAERVEVYGEVNGVCICPLCKGKGLTEDFWSKVLSNNSPVLAMCVRDVAEPGLFICKSHRGMTPFYGL